MVNDARTTASPVYSDTIIRNLAHIAPPVGERYVGPHW